MKKILLLFILISNLSFGQNSYIFYDYNTDKYFLENEVGQLFSDGFKRIQYWKNDFYIAQNDKYKYGIINNKGQTVIECQYSWASGIDYLTLGNENAIGVYDSHLNLIIPHKYHNIYHDNDKRIYAIEKDSLENYRLGVFNTLGEQIIPFEYQGTKDIDYSSNLNSFMRKNGKFGIIDTLNNILVPFEYDYMFKVTDDPTKLENGIQVDKNKYFVIQKVIQNNKLYGIIDNKGKIIIPIEYHEIYTILFNDKFFVCRKLNNYGLINVENKQILPFEYEAFYTIKDNYAVVRKSNKFQLVYIPTKAHTVFENMTLPEFFNGKTLVTINNAKNKLGFMDITGKVIVENKYDDIRERNDGSYIVYVNNRAGIVNQQGVEVIAPEYDLLDKRFFLSNDLLCARKNKKWGIINYNQNIIIPFDYDSIEPTKYVFIVKKDNLYAIMDKKNYKLLTSFKFKNVNSNLNDIRFSVLDTENESYNINYQGIRTTKK
jgi:hypothetical protein